MLHVIDTRDEKITQGYSSAHEAVDFVSTSRAGNNVMVIAMLDGTVESTRTYIAESQDTPTGGNYVYIDHGNGIRSQSHHLVGATVCVKKGDKVKRGQVIGQMGRSGKSTGVHLHFEVWKKGKRINPVEFLENYTEPAPAPPSGLTAGDKVTYSGRLYGDSAGNKAGKTVNGTYTASRVLEGKSHGVLLNDGLGWVRERDCVKADQKPAPEPPKPKTFTQGCAFTAGSVVYGTAANATNKIKPLSLSSSQRGKRMTADSVYAGGAVARYGNIGFFRVEDVTF